MFRSLVYLNWSGPESVEIGYFLRSWDNSSQGQLTKFLRGLITLIVACEQENNDRWTGLALDHLGIQGSVLQDYLAQGDSLSLANLIHFTRHANRSEPFAFIVLANLPRFDTHHTLPELQRDFCAVWNEVVQEAQNHSSHSSFVYILREIRHHYIALHRVTDAAPTAFSEDTNRFDPIFYEPSSYPLCNLPSHRSHSTRHVHDLPLGEAAASPPATISFSSSVPRHRDAILTAITPPA
jgi:hypothetical protein